MMIFLGKLNKYNILFYYNFIMFNKNKGCRCSAINWNGYSAISEYPFHRYNEGM